LEILPRISHRIGLDLNIIDTREPDEARWLQALLWPEHAERRVLLAAAIAHRARVDVDLRVGDGFALAPQILAEISADCVPCIYHTHVANQIPAAARESFLQALAEVGRSRDLVHLYNNIKPTLHLTATLGGRVIDHPVARTDGHARWFEWLVP